MGKGASADGAGAVRGPPGPRVPSPGGPVPPRGRLPHPHRNTSAALEACGLPGVPGCWSLKGCWVHGSVFKLNRKGLVVVRLEMQTFVYMF